MESLKLNKYNTAWEEFTRILNQLVELEFYDAEDQIHLAYDYYLGKTLVINYQQIS